MKIFLQSPLANVLLFSIFWAIEIFVTKLAFVAGVEVIPFTIQSGFVTLILLSIYILPKKLKELKEIPRHILILLLFANAIHFGLGGFLSNAGIQLTTAINAGFLMQFSTVTITIIAWLMLKEKMTISKILSLSAIMLGTFLLITKGQLIIPHIGDILILLACIAWGLGGVLVRKIFKQHSVSPEIVSLLKPVAGIPLLILFVLFSSLYPSSVKQIFQVNIFAVHQPLYILLNAFFVSLLWLFSARTLKIASASYAAIMSSITPILVALLAVIFLHEKIDLIQSIGILLIIASSFVTQLLKFDKH